ncbi:MAG: hypothetical protein ACFCUE_04470 [Candidatus Bathyarchaeia archaeon]
MTINQNVKPKKRPYKIGYLLAAIMAVGLMLTASVITLERPPGKDSDKEGSSQTAPNANVLINSEQQTTLTPERNYWSKLNPKQASTPTPTPKPSTTPTPTLAPTTNQPTTQPTLTQTITPTQTTSVQFQIGVNLLSTYHQYSPKYTTDAILNRDFAKFQNDGITVISLSLYWYRIEGNTQGSYNGTLPDGSIYGDAFLDNVKHVITVANQYGIKVLVTFHTLWGDDSSWCTPDYVVDPVSGKNIGLAIVRSPEMRQAYINMVGHTTNYLAGTPGIWAWAVLNEPWYWGRTSNEHDFKTSNGQTQKSNFLTLIQDLSNTVKANDGRPVTVRFCNTKQYTGTYGEPHIKNIFKDDWGMDSRLFNAIDFVGFNVYPTAYSELDATLQSMTKENIVESAGKNKQIWITEFGYATNDQTKQANVYETMLKLFANLPIEGCLAWQWTDSKVQDANSQSSYNICANTVTGEGKLAYKTMIGYTMKG